MIVIVIVIIRNFYAVEISKKRIIRKNQKCVHRD